MTDDARDDEPARRREGGGIVDVDDDVEPTTADIDEDRTAACC
jgi:hypothetical protein